MEDTLINFLEKQEYFQGGNKRFLEIIIGNNISDNVFQELVDNDDKYYQHLKSKSYSSHFEQYSQYYFNDKIIQINHLNKNKKQLISDILINSQKIKNLNNHYDILLEIKEIYTHNTPIPSQDNFLNIDDYHLEIFTINPHIQIIYNLNTKNFKFILYYPVNKKQIKLLNSIISEIENIIHLNQLTLKQF